MPSKRNMQRRLQTVLQDSLPPERLAQELWRVYDLSVERKSMRAAIDAIQLLAAYAYGQPTKRIETRDDTAEILTAWLADRVPASIADDTRGALVDGEIAAPYHTVDDTDQTHDNDDNGS